MKAYLRRGARELPGFGKYPNREVGYGRLVGEKPARLKCYIYNRHLEKQLKTYLYSVVNLNLVQLIGKKKIMQHAQLKIV